MILLSVKNGNCYFYFHSRLFQSFKAYPVSQELFFKARNLFKKSEQDFRVNINFEQSKKISNDQELIQSDPISCPQNQKGNNQIHKLTTVYERHSRQTE